jgi:hypothetical protein
MKKLNQVNTPKLKYTVELSIPYWDRELYLLKFSTVYLKDKYLMVYKSSGLAGHNSEGNLVPFYFLKDTEPENVFDMCLGWIRKEMYFKQEIRPIYSKDPEDFPDLISKLLIQLREDFKDSNLPQPDDEFYKEIDESKYVKSINNQFKQYIKSSEDLLDLNDLRYYMVINSK